MVRLEIVLHPDEAAVVLQALDKAREALRTTTNVSAETPQVAAASAPTPPPTTATASATASTPAPTPTRADAVMAVADAFLALPLSAAASTASASAAGPGRYQVFVHLDQDPFAAPGALVATLADGTRVSAETLRRIACDTGLVGAARDEGASVLDIGRRTRTISPALKRALWLRDRGCRFPGCSNTRFLHGHHIHHWLRGGATSLANLALLCPAHHRLVHEGGYAVECCASGDLLFRAPDLRPIPVVPPAELVADAVEALHEAAATRGVEIGPDTNLPWWDGTVPDYTWATEIVHAATRPIGSPLEQGAGQA